MTFTADSVPDLTGRVTLITGANGGLGLESAKVFARKGAHVVMAVRDQQKAQQAVAEVEKVAPAASTELVPLDLASQASVRAAAEQVLRSHDRLDVLMNNAGLMAMPERRTEDGFEMQLGVNHLGHWTLTALLMSALRATPGSRVVTVTSTMRHVGRLLDPENPHLEGVYDSWRAYGQSKLANYVFGLGLHRKLAAAGVPVASLVAHPGLTYSDLQKRTAHEGGGGLIGTTSVTLAKYAGMSVARGALPQIRAATDPGASSGELYGPRFGSAGAPVRLPVLRRGLDDAVRTLWEVSERETGVPLTV